MYFQAQKHLERSINKDLSRTNNAIASILGTTASLSIQNYLTAIAKKNAEIVTMLHSRFREGEMQESDAKKAAERILLSQKKSW